MFPDPSASSLDILFEDEALIFVNKPPGIVVQRGYDQQEPVLVETVTRLLERTGEKTFLMQRLDRGTSGVIFFSKLPGINANLTRQFERKIIRKTYLALCERELAAHQLIDAPLARVGPISFGVRREGKRSLTEAFRIAGSEAISFVRLQLLTGRTHQIRVHLAAIGHPLVGDWLYGTRNHGRPMLHASSLEMRHPLSGADLAIHARLPEDFVAEATRQGIAIASDAGNRLIQATD